MTKANKQTKIPSKLIKENFNNILQKGHKNCIEVLVTKMTKLITERQYRKKKVK